MENLIKIVTLMPIIWLSGLIYAYGQDEYQSIIVEDSTKASGLIPDSHLYIPDSNTPVKYIRVNFHFMLKSPGDPAYPGNFTPVDDGHGNTSYTGYDYAREYIDIANQRLASNSQMSMPPGNQTPVLETKYRYVLDAVYFHEDNSHYCRSFDLESTFSAYKENGGRVINVFQFCGNGGSTGWARMTGQRYVFSQGRWNRYSAFLSNPGIGDGMWANAKHLNHETGHNLSLLHTMMTNTGGCRDDWNDYCPDTPTRGEIIQGFGFDPCCFWSNYDVQTCSNNLMDYGQGHALTPHQLGRVHWTLEHEMKAYQTCYLDVNQLNICSIGYPQIVYLGRKITFGGGSCGWQPVVLENKEVAHLIASEEVILNPGFEVKLGAEFTIEMVTPCNN